MSIVKATIYSIAMLFFLTVAVLAAILFRNVQMNAATSALKIENGEVAIKKLNLLAAFGDRQAQAILGAVYACGWGVPKDEALSKYWLDKSAQFGFYSNRFGDFSPETHCDKE
jgi:TPR repeat protein